MTDVKMLTDVVKYPESRELIRAIDYEMRERGAERVRTAWHAVAAKREAERQCSLCGDCKPVAAYGGWCCAKALSGQEVTP